MPLSDRTMNAGSRYWRFVRLSASGRRCVEEWADARVSFEAIAFGNRELPDTAIQRSLWSIIQQGNDPDQAKAILCFRCFISHCVEQTCRQLVAQFGGEQGFTGWQRFCTRTFPWTDLRKPSLVNSWP